VCRRRGLGHHGQARRVHTERLSFGRLLFLLNRGLASRGILLLLLSLFLLLALKFLVREFDFLDGVAGALVVEFVVLGDDFGFAVFGVPAASCAVGES
jgi:hypothetical protein